MKFLVKAFLVIFFGFFPNNYKEKENKVINNIYFQ